LSNVQRPTPVLSDKHGVHPSGRTFSIIIPCRDEVKPKALRCLQNIDYPPELFEIIVIRGDNPSLQRNQGAKMARGEILAFTDDDCDVPSDWLKNANQGFKGRDVAILGGPNLTPPSDPLLAQIFGLTCSSPVGTASMSRRYRRAKPQENVDETALVLSNLFCKRSLFESGLRFEPLLFPNEENHFMNGAVRMGHGMYYDPDLFVHHPRKKTWTGFFKQFMGYGAGRGKQTRMDPGSLRPIHLAPSIFAVGLLSMPILALTMPLLIPYMLFALLLYMVIIGAESIRLSKQINWLAIPVLMASFLVIHLSYGLGIIHGLLSTNGEVKGRKPADSDISIFHAVPS
jgi:glycosyltransferase involved in cell wall biosynthesis